MGSRIGTQKAAANRMGIPIEHYFDKLENGFKHCWKCNQWHPRSEFNADLSRGDNLAALCRKAQSLRKPGKKITNIKQRQAHRIIQMRVLRGTMPNPNTILCLDCDHLGNDRRHEYDHYLGYEPPNNIKVEAVCSLCHAQRGKERRKYNGKN